MPNLMPTQASGTVPIEVVVLSLVSVEPITVGDSQWDVFCGLSPEDPSTGSLTMTRTGPNGGTYTSTCYVWPRFVFTRTDDPQVTRTLDGPAERMGS